MALVQFGSLVSAASGRVGALCFARSGGSPIVRTQPGPRTHDSPIALSTKRYFALSLAAWSALTTAQKQTWQNAARQFPSPNRLGLQRQLTAFSLFVACRMRAYTASIGFFDTANPATGYTLGIPCTVQIWPNGPCEVFNDNPHSGAFPFLTVHAQRFISTASGAPGRLTRVIGRRTTSVPSLNAWQPSTYMPATIGPGLIGLSGTPAPLEWFLVYVDQWLPGYGHKSTSTHLVQIPNVGSQLLTNGDFETGGTPPTGWTVTGSGSLTQSALLPYGDGFSGLWAVAAAQPQTQFFTHSSYRFSLLGATNYTLSWSYKVNSGNISYAYVAGTGMSNVQFVNALPITTGYWTRASYTITPSANATGCYILVRNLINIPGNVSFDNISLRKDTP